MKVRHKAMDSTAIHEILKYVIPSLITLIGVIVTVRKSHADTKAKIEEQSAVTLYRIKELEKSRTSTTTCKAECMKLKRT